MVELSLHERDNERSREGHFLRAADREHHDLSAQGDAIHQHKRSSDC